MRRKDREVQLLVSGEGICFNCKKWCQLYGDHARKRRYLDTRHDLTNLRPCCSECNVALESLPAAKLIATYPLSPLILEWRERMARKRLGSNPPARTETGTGQTH